jgi:hypothetical protein
MPPFTTGCDRQMCWHGVKNYSPIFELLIDFANSLPNRRYPWCGRRQALMALLQYPFSKVKVLRTTERQARPEGKHVAKTAP